MNMVKWFEGEWPAPLVVTIAYTVVAYHGMVFKWVPSVGVSCGIIASVCVYLTVLGQYNLKNQVYPLPKVGTYTSPEAQKFKHMRFDYLESR